MERVDKKNTKKTNCTKVEEKYDLGPRSHEQTLMKVKCKRTNGIKKGSLFVVKKVY